MRGKAKHPNRPPGQCNFPVRAKAPDAPTVARHFASRTGAPMKLAQHGQRRSVTTGVCLLNTASCSAEVQTVLKRHSVGLRQSGEPRHAAESPNKASADGAIHLAPLV